MALVEPPQAVADACGHGLACSFAFVAEPTWATGESDSATELVDQGLPFMVEVSGQRIARDFGATDIVESRGEEANEAVPVEGPLPPLHGG